jgi:type IV pilus assembly protein PilZ
MPTQRQGFLQLDLRDNASLYLAWMGFVEGGGLFIPTEDGYNLGDTVFVRVRMTDAGTKGVAGKVVWVTPKGALKPRERGIGIQIGRQDRGELQRETERRLAGTLTSGRPTQTL